MKNKLVVLAALLLSSTVFSQEIVIATPTISEVVELHVTFAPPPTAEAKKARKLMYTKAGKAICSGSFISPLGHVLTAKHCVDGADDIKVFTSDGRFYNAEIRGIAKRADLAVIQIGRFNVPHFKLATELAQSESLTIIGSPLGLTNTKTAGVVGKIMGDLLILDCTAVPGNSGGPVLNKKGEVVGVVSAMVIVFFGPAHLTVAQSVDSIRFFYYEMMGGK